MIWVLIGHRGVGKTTLARRAAELLGRPFLDLDEKIETDTGRSPLSWLAESEPKFRAVEIRTLREIAEPAVVALGAGIEAVPDSFGAIWIQRIGWEDTARLRQPRIRRELTPEEEFEWMRATREPRYAEWADASLEIPRHEGPDRSSARLTALIERLEASFGTELIRRSWWIGTPARVERQAVRVRQIGAAGVEIRTDLFDSAPIGALRLDPDRALLSIRTSAGLDLLGCFRWTDIDARWARVLPWKPQGTHILHSDHQASLALPSFPSEANDVKWAPAPATFGDLKNYSSFGYDVRRRFQSSTILPQTSHWTWLRILEAIRHNRWNYISGNAMPHEAGAPEWSTWGLYTHATPAAKLYGLSGDPVASSLGPEFHNDFFRKKGRDAVYVSIPVPPDELEKALNALSGLGFAGLSVTAPHKKAVLDLPNVQPDSLARRLGVTNTLRTDGAGGWHATNTDLTGMKTLLGKADLPALGRVLVIGKGGVSPAVAAALQDRHTAFRHEGFRALQTDDKIWAEPWDLVINASGRDVRAGPRHKSAIWIDLRYGMQASNDGGDTFLAGETFFEAQAEEQHRFWGF